MPEWYTIVGYVGSFLIALSLTMKNIIKLRWINLFGAAIFAVYGVIVSAIPVTILNSYIVLIDIFYLSQIYRSRELFSISPVLNDNHLYLNKFIDFYKDDILKYFPDFSKNKFENPNYYFILRNLVPAGLFIYEQVDRKTIEIKLDYAIPNYRDNKNGEYIYNAEIKFLKAQGIEKMQTYSNVKEHVKYLTKIGFERNDLNKNLFYKNI
ncbi:MAG: hypothetical protein D8M61_00830 [Ignavibacteriae bacterium]|nr:hypothetical protein [Ignavibacteriota bacterium]